MRFGATYMCIYCRWLKVVFVLWIHMAFLYATPRHRWTATTVGALRKRSARVPLSNASGPIPPETLNPSPTLFPPTRSRVYVLGYMVVNVYCFFRTRLWFIVFVRHTHLILIVLRTHRHTYSSSSCSSPFRRPLHVLRPSNTLHTHLIHSIVLIVIRTHRTPDGVRTYVSWFGVTWWIVIRRIKIADLTSANT